MTITRKLPLGLKAPKPKRNPGYLAKVRALPCCICQAFGESQVTPTTAHHVIHHRYSQRKVPDEMAIALCHDHHQGWKGVHTIPAQWREMYGDDHEYIAITQDAILGVE
ncbi:MAG: DUF968 domain-containing protein [Novosphingobium sp.]|nr:DUF968 domain-containing protein [Novosphingobium sp.]